MAPRRFGATLTEGPTTYELEIELDDRGHSVCRELRVVGDQVPEVRTAGLLKRATAAAASLGTFGGVVPGNGWRMDALPANEARVAYEGQESRNPKSRRDARPESHLAEFAAEYAAGLRRGETKGVALEDAAVACGISRTKAYRWLADAKSSGLVAI